MSASSSEKFSLGWKNDIAMAGEWQGRQAPAKTFVKISAGE
jgi:hypothetical protein